jgi:hypothetical protein
MTEETFVWFAGVDWSSEKHQVCILDQQGTIAGERSFAHSGAGLAELGDWLLSIAGAASAVAVGIEVPHGPVVDSLIDRGFVVHSINPKQLDRLRDRFSVAGAKDDRRDGYVLADGIRTDRRFFHRLHVADPRVVELRAWSVAKHSRRWCRCSSTNISPAIEANTSTCCHARSYRTQFSVHILHCGLPPLTWRHSYEPARPV